jgi:hypothetical protein
MSTDTTWEPFGIPDEDYAEAADGRGQKVLNISWRRPKSERKAARVTREAGDSSTTWLRSALVGLGVLAATAAAVSFAAQYQLIYTAKGIRWASVLEAGIPDVGSMVFAALGIALALKGKRALRARGGNLACVGLSLAMNLLAAAAGWRGVAIWVMPSAVYAFASDTLIGVIRAHVLASQGRTDSEKTALAALGGLLLWTLRLLLAPPSTLKGFRSWIVESCPVAPGRAAVTAPNVAVLPAAPVTPGSAAISSTEPEARVNEGEPGRARRPRGESKTAQFLALVIERHGKLANIDPAHVSRIASELAPEVGLNEGSARSALRPRVLAARGGAS